MLIIAKAIYMKRIFHQQADEQSRIVRRLQKILLIRQTCEIVTVMCAINPMKDLQILHPHRE
jgi:hypothetical protein